MSQSLAITIAAYAIALAVFTAVRAGLGRTVAREQGAAVIVLELASAGQAIGAVVGLASGHETSETGVLIAYLVASVAILPLVWGAVAGDGTRWAGVTLALGLVAIAVVSVRAMTIWHP